MGLLFACRRPSELASEAEVRNAGSGWGFARARPAYGPCRPRVSLAPPGVLRQYGEMDYETASLRLPPNVDRMTAAVQLTVAAEYSGWELAQVRLFRDGTRQVLLRRSRSDRALPALSY